VIAVRVRDHGAVDRKPGVDVQVGGWTVKTAIGETEHAAEWANATVGWSVIEQEP